jgi:hypothetical protein
MVTEAATMGTTGTEDEEETHHTHIPATTEASKMTHMKTKGEDEVTVILDGHHSR